LRSDLKFQWDRHKAKGGNKNTGRRRDVPWIPNFAISSPPLALLFPSLFLFYCFWFTYIYKDTCTYLIRCN